MDCSSVYLESLGYFSRTLALLIQSSNLPDFLFVELAGVYCFSMLCSVFARFVGCVVRVCSGEAVVRVHTKWIITVMANQHTRRDRPSSQHPRYSMRLFHSSFVSEIAVAFRSLQSGPEPARFCFLDVVPEPLFCWDSLGSLTAVNAAKLPTVRPEGRGWVMQKGFPADLADSLNFLRLADHVRTSLPGSFV
jgi:hypothetical protein